MGRLPLLLWVHASSGLQDSYLKSARDLHDLDRLDDWAAYLRDSWAGPLYHDGFYDMAVQLRTLLQKDEGRLGGGRTPQPQGRSD